jgi:hypothetical protein
MQPVTKWLLATLVLLGLQGVGGGGGPLHLLGAAVASAAIAGVGVVVVEQGWSGGETATEAAE